MFECSLFKNKHTGLLPAARLCDSPASPTSQDSSSNQLACIISPLMQGLKSSTTDGLEIGRPATYIYWNALIAFLRMWTQRCCKKWKVSLRQEACLMESPPREPPTGNSSYPRAEVTFVTLYGATPPAAPFPVSSFLFSGHRCPLKTLSAEPRLGIDWLISPWCLGLLVTGSVRQTVPRQLWNLQLSWA